MAGKTKNLPLTALFAAIIAVAAFIRIPAGPVPLTLQSTAVLLCGYCLGAGRGSSATLLYTAIGLAGLPVFTGGGGPAYLISPTFGYILGFTACAFTTGVLARINRGNSAVTAYFIMLAGLAALYIPGVLWLFVTLRYVSGAPASAAAILQTGLIIPFVGDLVKTIPAALIAVKIRPRIQYR